MVHTVRAHLDHEEKIPGSRLEQVLGEAKALFGHFLDLAQQPLLVVRAEVLDVDHVATNNALDLTLELGWVRVLALFRVGSEEAGHHDPVDAADGVRLGDAEHDNLAAPRREEIP